MSEQPAAAFSGLVDLACERLGGRALMASDEFFAERSNLLKPGRGVFIADKYTERGKWMDGWEPRRKRVPGHDWCIIALGVAGQIRGVDIDTNHFMGNHPPFASVDACCAPEATPEELRDSVTWTRVLEQVPLRRGAQNVCAVTSNQRWTHVRLNIYPAGGVARFRVYGVPGVQPSNERMDLASLVRGGQAVACSDMFFSPMNNLLLPDGSRDMGDGWETRRSRPPGDDWVIVQLVGAGRVDEVLVDTRHFKGNYPESCAVDGLCWPGASPHALTRTSAWTEIVEKTALRAHCTEAMEVANSGPWTHIRLRIYPDGGVARLRVMGQLVAIDSTRDSLLTQINTMDASEALEALHRCCGSTRWAAAMVEKRPFVSREQLFGVASDVWWHLGDGDWLEAFGHHPQIGQDLESLRAKFAATAQRSEEEQAGIAGADDETLRALAEENEAYLARYGFIFIVCASGKSAAEMLKLLRGRMQNERHLELRIAAGQQEQITRLRLGQLGE